MNARMENVLLWLLCTAVCYPSHQTHRATVHSPTPHQTNGAVAVHNHNIRGGGSGEEGVCMGGKGAGWTTHTCSILRPTQKLLKTKIQSMLTTTVLLIICQELGGVGVLTFPFLTAQYCSEGAW